MTNNLPDGWNYKEQPSYQKLSKAQKVQIEDNNDYLADLGETLGFELQSRPTTRNGIKSWEILLRDETGINNFGRSTVLWNSSDNHKRVIDDSLMKALVNDHLNNDKTSVFTEFKEYFNKYMTSMDLVRELQNSLEKKTEHSNIKKMKI